MGSTIGLFKHCEENNLERVTECLSRGVDVNTVSEDGHWSGLTIAAKENFPVLLDVLLFHPDIKINDTTKDLYYLCQSTALMFASAYDNSTIMSRLVQELELDFNYQETGPCGLTAAHLACEQGGSTQCVRILAESGKVDWNPRDKFGQTPLFLALQYSEMSSDIVNIIVKQPSIDFNVKTDDGETLAQAAISSGGVTCVKTLAAEERCNCWNVPGSYGDTPIMSVVKKGRTDLLEILLNCPRVDLSCKDRAGWSLISRAIQTKKLGGNVLKHFSVFIIFIY